MITIQNISFGYGLRKNVIRDLSLTIPEGGRICLEGRSGAGKTTLLRLLMGLENPRRGEIRGTEGKHFSAVFQEDRLIGGRTVLQNVSLFSNEETARQILNELGLGDCLDRKPAELSGGMKRRVALARALAHPFDILILDEAFTGLDQETKELCCRAVRRAIPGKTLVMVTHDEAEAQALEAQRQVI